MKSKLTARDVIGNKAWKLVTSADDNVYWNKSTGDLFIISSTSSRSFRADRGKVVDHSDPRPC